MYGTGIRGTTILDGNGRMGRGEYYLFREDLHAFYSTTAGGEWTLQHRTDCTSVNRSGSGLSAIDLGHRRDALLREWLDDMGVIEISKNENEHF